jgi:hypothetical protein
MRVCAIAWPQGGSLLLRLGDEMGLGGEADLSAASIEMTIFLWVEERQATAKAKCGGLSTSRLTMKP